ncbi:MAG: dienelactone hydrolase family protein [Terriglobia bacterium]
MLEIRAVRKKGWSELSSAALAVVFAAGVCGHATVGAAESLPIPPGRVIPRVVCQNDLQQTYAIYLPSAFVSAKKWPIVYAFDPGARGSIPVELFRPAAEKYGYIVVGSNNSQNGPMGLSVAAAQAVWIDTHTRFPIDDARVYTTGFSGGARVALRMALMLSGRVAGVIASGGPLPEEFESPASIKFMLYGLAGTRDFNYTAMKQLNQRMATLGVAHRFEPFEGAHQWPPPEACAAALEWMEIQALKADPRRRDETFLNAQFNTRLKQAEADQTAGRTYRAFHQYEEIVEDFRGLIDVAPMATKIEQLRASREFREAAKQAEKRERKMEEQDLQNTQKAWALLSYLTVSAGSSQEGRDFTSRDDDDASPSLTGPSGPDTSSLGESSELERLVMALNLSGQRRKAQERKESDDGILAERQIQRVVVGLVELSRELVNQKKYRPAVSALEIAQQAAPDSPWVLYSLARALALSGKKSRALKALGAAVENGFTRRESIESDHAFDALREEPAYKTLIDKIKSASAASG